MFLADLTPAHNTEFPGVLSTDEFHPRGAVLGPDGLLYVSVTHDLDSTSPNFNPLAGWILRFDPNNNGRFVDVFASDGGVGCAMHLHRPEGIVFGPDGRLYVTAFRGTPPTPNTTDTDKILIFDSTGVCLDLIELDQSNQPLAFAQAILFGPDGFLFVPINGNGPDTGAVRRYNVVDKTFENFVLPAAQGGPLGQPWYLTFGKTDPATLDYPPSPPHGPDQQICLCQDGTLFNLCVQVDCSSGPAQDVICGPVCASHGGESATGCISAAPMCSIQ